MAYFLARTKSEGTFLAVSAGELLTMVRSNCKQYSESTKEAFSIVAGRKGQVRYTPLIVQRKCVQLQSVEDGGRCRAKEILRRKSREIYQMLLATCEAMTSMRPSKEK